MSIKLIREGELPFINDHSVFSGRDMPDQHTIDSITGLRETLNTKYELSLTGIPDSDLQLRYLTIADFKDYKAAREIAESQFRININNLITTTENHEENITTNTFNIDSLFNDMKALRGELESGIYSGNSISSLNIEQVDFTASADVNSYNITITDTNLKVIKPTVLKKESSTNNLAIEGVDYNVEYSDDTNFKITFLSYGDYIINYVSGELTDSEYNVLLKYVQKVEKEFVSSMSGTFVNPAYDVQIIYDEKGRVYQEEYSGEINKTITYEYNINDSITKKTVLTDTEIKTAIYTYDIKNNLISISDNGTEKPLNGTKAKSFKCELEYDEFNNMIRETYSGEINKVISYAYNSYGDVLSKTITENGITQTANYLYDEQRKLISIEDSGTEKVAVVFKEAGSSGGSSDGGSATYDLITEPDIDLIFSTILI